MQARIGEGGMGTVYLSHTRGGQPVALKVIRREYGQDPDFRRRFEQEVQAARRVQGYHIVPVVDHDTTGELPWLASAFIAGIPLHDALVAFGPLPLPAVFQLVGCAARALTSIHAAGVIHRDLKPSNILLGSQGPYVIDFGIARAADATQLTQSGGLIGTPQYMSPEHALGERVTPATDVFSLGLIAAVAATGRHPYGDGGAITIAAQIANTAMRPPQLDGYDDTLRSVLERCLTADPAARIGTEELAALCQESTDRNLSDFTGWLPAPLTAEITRREQAAQTPPQPTAPQMPAAPPATPPAPPTAPPQDPTTQPAAPGTTQGMPQASPTGGFGPAPQGPTPAYGYPPPAPETYNLSPQSPVPAPAPKKSRRGLKAALIAIVLVLAIGSGAAAAVWVLGKTDDSKSSDTANDGKESGKATATPSESPTDSATDDGQSGDQGTGEDVTNPTGSADVPPNAQFVEKFKDEPVSVLRPGGLETTYVDLDAPKVDPTEYMDSDVQEFSADSTSLRFVKSMGKATGTSPEQCLAGAEQNPFTETLDADSINRDQAIVKGDHLCTVTGEGNLAMWTITEVDAPDDLDYLPNLKGTVTVWEIQR
ncbi:serine/threonine-protein kinase [Streptomyces ipomoeae]|uniref:serine/threonine-protein kinase n=2 Tax=Streptomyces ipomoeae TaxID=103232 RepID=UPI00246813DA|nr:serine/threonine-protein kinase [Streptomyces ipomoeae]MDX2934554.1 protein kinase [Streptomyces ipomoeae]